MHLGVETADVTALSSTVIFRLKILMMARWIMDKYRLVDMQTCNKIGGNEQGGFYK